MTADPAPSDPSAPARFGRLELIARLVVEGVTAGLHRSPFKGASVEFAEHRQYGPGDEIRHIDWRAFGKTDRYYIKEFEESTSLTAHLVVDSSASMAYAGEAAPWSKIEQARRLAAALARLMIGQRDAVGLAVSAAVDDPRAFVPPRSSPGHLPILYEALDAAAPAGEVPISRVLRALAGRIGRRGLTIVFSDGFEPLDDLTGALRRLRNRRHEVLFFHVLDPDEETFPFSSPVGFRPLEGSAQIIEPAGAPAAVQARYRARFEAFRRGLRESLQGMGADYVPAPTNRPVDRILLGYLGDRARRAPRRTPRSGSAGG